VFSYLFNASYGLESITCNVGASTWNVTDSAVDVQPLWGARIKINVLGKDVAGTPVNYAIDKWFLTNKSGLADVLLPNATNNLRYCYSPS
jgi:hypothetical protein